MSRYPRELRCPIGTSGQVLVIDVPVLAHFARHRQVRWWHREAGGQLFSRSMHALNGFVLVIVGTAPFPDGLYTAVSNREAIYQLSHETQHLEVRRREVRRL